MGAFGLVIEAALLQKKEPNNFDIYYAIFVFFSTHLAYHFHRFFGYNAQLKPIESPRHNWYNKNKKNQLVLTVISALASAFCLYNLGIGIIFYLIPLFALSGLYNVKIGTFKGLRHIPFVKTFVIALVWAYSVSVPLIYYNPYNPTAFLFLRNFLFILAITLPFDIRDLERDPKWLKTLPQVLGVNATKNLAISLLFVFLMSCWFYNKNAFFLKADFIVVLITSLLVYSAKPNQGDRLYLIGLDGTLILRVLLVASFYLFS